MSPQTEHVMRNAGPDALQAGIKRGGSNINNLRYADDTTLMAESEEELKSLLMTVKEERERASLKLNIKENKIMASGSMVLVCAVYSVGSDSLRRCGLPVYVIEGEMVEVVTAFLFLGSEITVYGDCSREIRRRLLLSRKAKINLDIVLKSRDITLLTKVCRVKAMVLPVVMYICESWTIKKLELQRIDAFELWCWRRLLRVP